MKQFFLLLGVLLLILISLPKVWSADCPTTPQIVPQFCNTDAFTGTVCGSIVASPDQVWVGGTMEISGSAHMPARHGQRRLLFVVIITKLQMPTTFQVHYLKDRNCNQILPECSSSAFRIQIPVA